MKKLFFGAAFACAFGLAQADLPKAKDLYPYMGLGWNLGNTMEVPKDPTNWGNIVPTADIIKGVKDAGFNTIRIPCAWYTHSSNGVIDANWLATVKSVVDMALQNNMFVLLNSHWDDGWLEDHVWDGDGYDRNGNAASNKASDITALQEKFWKQIADYFKNYDERLIFASANEPGVNDPWNGGVDNGQWGFDQNRMGVLKKYHEACLKAVRESGGNNATRTVIVQMPRTEIDKFDLLKNNYPTDPAGAGYTMAEAHFYPYQFAFMENDATWGKVFYYWESETTGDANRTCSGSATGSKTFIDSQFKKLQSAFVDNGIPVVIGEMGINKRYSRVGQKEFNLDTHLKAVAAWYGYTVKSAKAHGLVPCVWDTGYERKYEADSEDAGDGDMTIIRRQAKYGTNLGQVIDTLTMNTMKREFGASLEPVVSNPGSTSGSDPASSSSVVPGAASSSSINMAINAAPLAAKITLTRQGNMLVAQGERAEIRLFDMNGNQIRQVSAISNRAILSLAGLSNGIYIAKSGATTLKVNLK